MSLKLNVRRMQRTSVRLRPPQPPRGRLLEPLPRPMRMPMLQASKPQPASRPNPMRARPPRHSGRIPAKSAMRR